MSKERVSPEQLVFMHQGLVRALARGIHRSFPSYIELDDLIGYGQIGLAQAARAGSSLSGLNARVTTQPLPRPWNIGLPRWNSMPRTMWA